MTVAEAATTFTIAQAAERTQLTAHTLRYYERDELMLTPVARGSNGHRRYTDEDLRWVEMVTRLRATGMPIREVRRYAGLVRSGGHEQDRLRLLRDHRLRVLSQLAEITDHLQAIDTKIRAYVDSVGPSDRLEDASA